MDVQTGAVPPALPVAAAVMVVEIAPPSLFSSLFNDANDSGKRSADGRPAGRTRFLHGGVKTSAKPH